MQGRISLVVLACLIAYGALAVASAQAPWVWLPIAGAGLLVGIPLVIAVGKDALHRQMGADVLALLAIITGAVMQEWLVVGIIALMVSGGTALESAATLRASEILAALARRSPTIAHLVRADGTLTDVSVSEVRINDLLVVLPHEICPIDGVVVQGTGAMDESFLTGEPYVVPKAPGTQVMSGAINSTIALHVKAEALVEDSRYAQIVAVLSKAERERPPIRRLADRLGAA